MRRRQRVLCASLAVAALLAGCVPSDLTIDDDDTVRVASYDFTENVILAEIYAQALQRNGIEVSTVHGLGTRELVIPALEQGHVDVVVDYLGAALDFVAGSSTTASSNAAEAAAALRAAFADRAVTVLDHARAEDQNGFAISIELAVEENLVNLSDLIEIAPTLRFGAPPECPTRRYCLIGLQETYGLRFESFQPMPSRAATVEALLSGEIDIGLLETTDPRLSGARLVLLVDDRGLQPRENIVPLVRDDALDRAGGQLADVLDAVSAELTTADLIELNGDVEIDNRPAAEVASDWLSEHGFD